jgi:alcohol dehydrogenase
MTTGTLRLPPRIHFGYGARAQLPRLLAPFGTRVLAVVDPFIARSPLFARVLAALEGAGLETTVYSDVVPELPVDSLVAAGAVARAARPDAILAVGGGSALDAAKVIALLTAHDVPLADCYGENNVPGPVTPIVAVPTTAGTGSEVTPVAVVSDPERELKVGISSPDLVPAAAVVDPELTLGAPAAVTAFSGIDALVHVVESFTTSPLELDWAGELPVFTGRNAFTDAVALDAAARLYRWLPVAVDEPGDRAAREQLALGSLLGGLCFSATGTHLSHALQYPIGALTHTPHGLGTGLLLPYVLDALRGDPGTEERLARLATAFGSAGGTRPELAGDAVAMIARLCHRIGVPRTLAELSIERAQLPHVAELGLRSGRLIGVAPAHVTRELLQDILENAHAGRLSEGSSR